jgi:hypothetical protein
MFVHQTIYRVYKANYSCAINYMKVRGKLKYELQDSYVFTTGILLDTPISERYYSMNRYGVVCAYSKYRWNGADWCPDTKKVIIPSLGHDILCQMFWDGYLEEEHIPIFNDLFIQHCLDCEMPQWQASFYRRRLRGYWRNKTND